MHVVSETCCMLQEVKPRHADRNHPVAGGGGVWPQLWMFG